MATEPSKAFTEIYDQLYAMMAYNPKDQKPIDGVVVTIKQNFSLDPSMYQNIATPSNPTASLVSAYNFANLADAIPNDKGGNLSQLYKSIVRGANTPKVLTEEQEERYKNLREKLFVGTIEAQKEGDDGKAETVEALEWTDLYKQYNMAKSDYEYALTSYYKVVYGLGTNKVALNPDNIADQGRLKEQESLLNTAYQNWVAAGKDEVEKLLAEVATAANDGLAALFADEKAAIEKYPTMPNDNESFGWTVPLQLNWLPAASATQEGKIEDVNYKYDTKVADLEGRAETLEADLEEAEEQGADRNRIASMRSKIRDIKQEIAQCERDRNNEIRKIERDPKTAKVSSDDTIYSEFSINLKNTKETQHSKESSFKVGISASWKIWSVGNSGGYHNATHSADSESSDITITGKIARVPIVRTWFNPYIFSAQNWSHTGFGPGAISDGKGNGAMPMYATSLIVVKDMSVESAFASTHITANETDWTSETSIGIGPFRFGPKCCHHEEDFLKETHDGKVKLTNRGYQLLGSINAVVPYSPPQQAK